MYELAQEELPPLAILGALQLPEVEEEGFEASLDELERLCDTLGLVVVGRFTQKRDHIVASAYFGAGKLEEIAAEVAAIREENPDRPVYFVIDHDISPWQMRAVEDAIDAVVMDRTGVILDIFHRHASSKQARAQVELARLAYLAPRLRESKRGAERQRGGIGGKGAGESRQELGRRQIRDRMAELRREIETIQQTHKTRQQRRDGTHRVALLGYTNAGKSTLMRALSSREVYVANKLFATLDTTMRQLDPPASVPILVSDTVGFIRNLPHGLVASFRSTLEEALEADLLLHVIDASDLQAEAHMAVTEGVLREIGAESIPTQLVFNKRDFATFDRLADLQRAYPDALFVSSLDPDDVAAVREHIVRFIEGDQREVSLFIPHARGDVRAALFKHAEVLHERYDERGGTYQARATPAALEAFTAFLVHPEA